jgi:UDP-glucose 4-epimerase
VRVLLVGGGSFIGAYVARRLLADGHAVVAYDVNAHDNAVHGILGAAELARVTFVRGDVLDSLALLSTCREHAVDAIVHLAAALSPECDARPALGVRVNCDGLNHSFEAARLFALRRVVWASSIAVYGPQELYAEEFPDEHAPHHPTTVYGACKSLNEFLGHHYFERFGVDNIGLRFTVVYGAGRLRGEWAYQLNRELVEKPALGLPGRVPGADALVDWQYVEDAAQAVVLALYHNGPTRTRVFNTRGDRRTVREAVECVRRLMPAADIEATPGTARGIAKLSARRIEEELGYAPRFSLEDGLRASINAYRRRAGLPEI